MPIVIFTVYENTVKNEVVSANNVQAELAHGNSPHAKVVRAKVT
jgi:hypothetical protein